MREEFEKMAVAGKIEGRHVEPLVRLTTTGYCMHRSWGFGKIKTVDTVFARFIIDFQGKPNHREKSEHRAGQKLAKPDLTRARCDGGPESPIGQVDEH